MTPAALFRALGAAWDSDSADMRCDQLAADLAAQVAADGPARVALLRKDAVPQLFGLVFFLDAYGLNLRQRYRQQGDGVFVFLELAEARPSQFVGEVRELSEAA